MQILDHKSKIPQYNCHNQQYQDRYGENRGYTDLKSAKDSEKNADIFWFC